MGELSDRIKNALNKSQDPSTSDIFKDLGYELEQTYSPEEIEQMLRELEYYRSKTDAGMEASIDSFLRKDLSQPTLSEWEKDLTNKDSELYEKLKSGEVKDFTSAMQFLYLERKHMFLKGTLLEYLELMRTRNKLSIRSFACCLISNLIQINDTDREGIAETKKTLKAILGMLNLVRDAIALKLWKGRIHLGFNLDSILQLLFIVLYYPINAIMFVLSAQLRKYLIEKLAAWAENHGKIKVLECMGLFSLMRFLISSLLGPSGLYRKLIQQYKSGILFAQAELKKEKKNADKESILLIIDFLRKVIYSLIAGLGLFEYCKFEPNIETNIPHSPGYGESENADIGLLKVRKADSDSTTMTSDEPFGLTKAEVEGLLNGQYQPEDIIPAEIKEALPGENVLTQFLVTYLGIPASEAITLSKTSLNKKKCFSELEPEEATKIQKMLANLGINA